MMLTINEAYALMNDPNRTESLAEIVAQLSDADKLIVLEGVDMDALQYDWAFWGRPKQHIPTEPYYNIHLLLLGRGSGKTRTMAEDCRKWAMEEPGIRMALMGRSQADTRDVMVLGESGLLAIPQPEEERPIYRPSEAKVIWPNGSEAKILSAEVPDAVRGGQFHRAYVDEFAAHTPSVGVDGLTAFENLRIATRLGEHPTLIVATTPKRVAKLRALIDESKDPENKIRVVTGSTMENRANLSAAYMDVITGAYAGTSIARQELHGEMLDEDPEGALWSEDTIKLSELTEEQAKRLPIRVVGVDPTVAENPTDECGIIAFGATASLPLHRRRGVVLEDATMHGSPAQWAREVVRIVKKWNAWGVVIESNQGFELLRMTLHNVDPTVRVALIHSSKSKKTRAEPVSQMYEQGRIKHLREFPLLTDQQTTWEPGLTKKSPDRIDALTFAATAAMIKPPKGLDRKKIRAVRMPSALIP